MAWTAKIAAKGIVEKALLVNVAYTNGTIGFNEVLDMTGGTLDALSQKVAARLATLEATQTLTGQIVVGAFTPSVPVVAPLDTFIAAMRHFTSCKRAVDLGLMLATDLTYTNAQAAMIAAFDPSFIDSI